MLQCFMILCSIQNKSYSSLFNLRYALSMFSNIGHFSAESCSYKKDLGQFSVNRVSLWSYWSIAFNFTTKVFLQTLSSFLKTSFNLNFKNYLMSFFASYSSSLSSLLVPGSL